MEHNQAVSLYYSMLKWPGLPGDPDHITTATVSPEKFLPSFTRFLKLLFGEPIYPAPWFWKHQNQQQTFNTELKVSIAAKYDSKTQYF